MASVRQQVIKNQAQKRRENSQFFPALAANSAVKKGMF
jgi:hypothetical protein